MNKIDRATSLIMFVVSAGVLITLSIITYDTNSNGATKIAGWQAGVICAVFIIGVLDWILRLIVSTVELVRGDK